MVLKKKMKNFRTIQAFFLIGSYVFVLTKSNSSEKNNEILERIQDFTEMELGTNELAFITKIHAGKGCNTKREDGVKLICVVNPSKYSEIKRLKGLSGTLDRLIDWIGINKVKIVKPRK